MGHQVAFADLCRYETRGWCRRLRPDCRSGTQVSQEFCTGGIFLLAREQAGG